MEAKYFVGLENFCESSGNPYICLQIVYSLSDDNRIRVRDLFPAVRFLTLRLLILVLLIINNVFHITYQCFFC